MTRKQYIRRISELITAIYNHPESEKTRRNQLGISLKYSRDHANEVIETHGSYAKAWESLKPARDFFGVE